MQPMLPPSRNRFAPTLLWSLLLSLMCVQAHAYAGTQNEHPVTLSGTTTLRAVFKAIKQQTGFAVMYSTAATALNQDEKVSVNFKDTPLDDVLAYVLKGKELDWKYNDDVLIIHKKERMLPEKKISVDSTVTPAMLTGKVTDAKGTPLPGVTVQVKGSNQGTTTDAEGNFTLAKVGNGQTLLLSSVGYARREIPVNGRSILTQLNVDVNNLDETVIIAYGETTRRLSTGNISSIKAKDIEKQPVSNPLLALQGRVPGVFIEQATGVPGSGVKIRIQGQNSLSQGSEPLYVIDGVPYMSEMLNGLSGIQGRTGGGTGNPFSYINPADIESIDILKDADATSIYGSRAAAGAILITTKKGKAGKTEVGLNVQQGWSKVGHFMDMLNTRQYLEMRHEAFRNDGKTPGPTDYDVNGTWDTTRNTDWQKALIGGTAKYTDAQLSVSGGATNTTFLVGAGYHRETTVFPGDLQDQKGSLHLNINHRSSNQRFKLQMDGKYLVDNSELFYNDLTGLSLQLAPDAPLLYNPDGSLNWAQTATGISTWTNPLSDLLRTYSNRVNNLISNAVVTYELLTGLHLKANLGYTNLIRNEQRQSPLAAISPENRPFSSRYAYFNNETFTSWVVEPQISYKKKLGKSILDLLIGSTFLDNQSNQQKLKTSGFTNDLQLKNLSAATSVTSGGTTANTYKYNALFGRVNYNWEEKYILNLTARRDGSSRFGSENLFNNFWSVGGAWLFSNEAIIQHIIPFLSFGKLRISYGTSGNDQIGDYTFMNLYYTSSRPVPYQGVVGLRTTDLPNPYLQWEETRKLQAGFDLGIFSDRLLLNVTYYRNRSSNQLQSYELPIITGVSGITTNFPTIIQNSGWELTLNTINITGGSFSWNSAINLTIPKNKLVAYKDLENSSYASSLIVGQPFTIFRLYNSLGVDPATGVYIFSDSKGNPTSNPAYPADAQYLLNTSPKMYGGFQNSINYQNFSIDFLFQYVNQSAQGYKFGIGLPGQFNRNEPTMVMARWQKPGDQKIIQKFSTGNTLSTPFIRALQSNTNYPDGSYLRLKNVSFSWQIPASLVKKWHMQQARVYAQGQNLLTFTKYNGLDPESKSNTSLPPLQTLTLGIQLSL